MREKTNENENEMILNNIEKVLGKKINKKKVLIKCMIQILLEDSYTLDEIEHIIIILNNSI